MYLTKRKDAFGKIHFFPSPISGFSGISTEDEAAGRAASESFRMEAGSGRISRQEGTEEKKEEGGMRLS